MNTFFIACALAACALLPMGTMQSIVAAAASTLFESTPFLLAGSAVATMISPRFSRLWPLLGCGCGGGPAAQSIPVAWATALTFGPHIAFGRWAAAVAIALLRRPHVHARRFDVLAELRAIVPFALAAGAAAAFMPRLSALSAHPVAVAAFATAAAIFASPCGFATLALAVTARTISPLALLPVLAISGIADAGCFLRRSANVAQHDAFAYALGAAACLTVAGRHGATFLHPHFTAAIGASAAVLACMAWKHRRARCAAARWAPAVMLAATISVAPPPASSPDVTTLADTFAGERFHFTGMVRRFEKSDTVVRYRITCCRADAQPLAIRLEKPLPFPEHTWVSVDGTFVERHRRLVLAIGHYRRERVPADLFLYR